MVSAGSGRGTLAVVGGGVIGLTCALAAADAGWRVRVFDAGPAERASQVAGGMLGSLGEGHPGEDRLLALSVDSVKRWPALVDRLGDPSIVTATDSLFVASTAADAERLDHLARFVWAQQPSAGATLNQVSARDIRAMEPMLGTRLVGGYRAEGEWALDNRRLLTQLRRAGGELGVEYLDTRVATRAELPDDQVVLAAGLGTNALWPAADLYGAKGEVLRLHRTRWSVPPPRHVVRAVVGGRNVYLVPRADGIVVGATQYEPQSGNGTVPEVGGVADLLADAIEVMPGLRTYELVEAGAGLRPCTPDGLPIISRVDDRTVIATGHGRNGIVLAPVTADAVVRLLDDAGADAAAGIAAEVGGR